MTIGGISTGLISLMLRRRPDGDLWLFLVCQTLAVAVVTAILLFTHKVEQAIYSESANMLAADLVLRSSKMPEQHWQSERERYDIEAVISVKFMSMLFSGEQMQLTDLRAVTEGYPLRGSLTSARTLDAPAVEESALPEPGEIWLDEKSASTLQVDVGTWVEVGNQRLRFSRVLHDEPGSVLPSLGFSGRALMRFIDLEKTGLIQPGSRVTYSWMLIGEQLELQRFRQWLEPLLSSHDSLLTQRDGDERTRTIMERASSFLNLSGMIAVLLAGIAAMIAAARYMSTQRDKVAIIRALGASRSQLYLVYLAPLLAFSSLALLIGYSLAYLLQLLALYLTSDWLELDSGLPASVFIAGAVTSLFCLLCFALPTLSSLTKISPMRLLRDSASSTSQSRGVMAFALAFLLLMYFYSSDWRSVLLVYSVIVALGLLSWLAVAIVTRLLTRMAKRDWQLSRALPLLLGLKAFGRQTQLVQLRTVALAITITTLAIVLALRATLLQDWRMQVPESAPNYFVMNLSEQRANAFRQSLHKQKVETDFFFPVARARLVAFNGLDYSAHGITHPDTIASLDREMVMTGTDVLPNGYWLTSGHWHGQGNAENSGEEVSNPGRPITASTVSDTPLLEVSVEQEYFQQLGLALGDTLTFSFAGSMVDAKVTSTRGLNWNSMQPNFYFVLEERGIKQFPYTYMTSFYVPGSDSTAMKALSREFPQVTLVDIGRIVERAVAILDRASLAVQSVAWLTVAAGLLVVVASLRATLGARLKEQTVARALGAEAGLLKASMAVELALGGLVAGLSGILAALFIGEGLGRWVFDMSVDMSMNSLLVLPLVAIVLVMLAGYWVFRPVYRQSPLAIWRGGGSG